MAPGGFVVLMELVVEAASPEVEDDSNQDGAVGNSDYDGQVKEEKSLIEVIPDVTGILVGVNQFVAELAIERFVLKFQFVQQGFIQGCWWRYRQRGMVKVQQVIIQCLFPRNVLKWYLVNNGTCSSIIVGHLPSPISRL